MSLTTEDLQQIEALFERKLHPVTGELAGLRNDVKEIYDMISDLQKDMQDVKKRLTKLEIATEHDKDFQKLDLEQKLFKLNTELLATAKQAGITLPR